MAARGARCGGSFPDKAAANTGGAFLDKLRYGVRLRRCIYNSAVMHNRKDVEQANHTYVFTFDLNMVVFELNIAGFRLARRCDAADRPAMLLQNRQTFAWGNPIGR